MSEYKIADREATGKKIEKIFKLLDSLHRSLDNSKWKLDKKLKEITEEQKEIRGDYLLKKAEIVSLLSDVWDDVDPDDDIDLME